LWYKTWYSIVDETKTGLQATLFVADNHGKLFVNFDLNIMQLIKETRYLQRLGFEIPEPLTNICLKESYYKNLLGSLSSLLTLKKTILGKYQLYKILRSRFANHSEGNVLPCR
jgi:dynein heavy chain